MIPSARSRLKAATSSAHDAVDRAFARFDLSSRDDYVAFLLAHAAAVLPVEAWLDRHAGSFADWPARRRKTALAADLAQLGVALPCPAPVFRTAPGAAATAGILYVMEGSRLGGRVLARRLAPGLPQAYLAPAEGAPSWPALLAAIETVVTDTAGEAEAIAAALDTFAYFAAAAAATPAPRRAA